MLSGNILSCIRNITLRTIKKPEGTNVPIVSNDKCPVVQHNLRISFEVSRTPVKSGGSLHDRILCRFAIELLRSFALFETFRPR